MNSIHKTLACLAAAFLFAVTSYSKPVEVVQPKIVGLYFHASWCSTCKALDPEMQAAAVDLKKAPFLLVTLDVSNKVTQHQAGMTASAMGLEDIYAQTGLKTGFVILIDTTTGEEVARITKDDNSASIVSRIKSLTGA